MEQVKDFLRLALKYRFWIAVGIASLLPIIGYFMASGAIADEEQKAKAEVESSLTAIKKFESNTRPVNASYKPLVEKEQVVLEKDVNGAWRRLYSRQAPLLTWPAVVEDRFMTWGRKWPENTQRNFVEQTIREYVETFDPYVQAVYQALNPFDPESGKGIIAAPPASMLLQPAVFDLANPPKLGEVWAAQERLWIQRTVLEVLAKVNEKAGAKDWLTAPVKQILELQVANDMAQDQQSLADGVALSAAEEILAPGEQSAAATTTSATTPAAMMGGGARGGLGLGAESAGGSGGMMGGRAASTEVKYLDTPNKDQVYIAPFYLSVYVRQDDIPELLIEFQNSPMDIQVLEIGITKPAPFSVQKPKKGDPMSFAGMGMMGGSGGMGRGMADMSQMMAGGYGGQMAGTMMSGRYGMSGGGGDIADMMRAQMGGGTGMRGMRGGAGAATPKRSGQDVRQENLRKREESAKAREKSKEKGKDDEEESQGSQVSDPYYDVVLVQIYGRASFYKTPPVEPTPVESPGAAPTDNASPTETAAAVVDPSTNVAPPAEMAPEATPAETLPAPSETPSVTPPSVPPTEPANLPESAPVIDPEAPGSASPADAPGPADGTSS